MIVVTEPEDLRTALANLRAGDCTLGFVPTMGALHEGHLSLVRLARERAKRVAVSIFVNPAQFGPHEDYRIYPRTPDKDLGMLEKEGVDLVFMPSAATMYRSGSAVTVHPGPVGSTFEGAIRPGHFQGVLTVVAKLFNLVQPQCAVFGQKDGQQLFLIRRMVEDLNFRTEIIEGETVREADGLAQSSRNVYLKVKERSQAVVLFRALTAGREMFQRGNRSLAALRGAMLEAVADVPEFVPDYATAVDEKTFEEIESLPNQVRLIVAGKLGSVRLIDNFRLIS